MPSQAPHELVIGGGELFVFRESVGVGAEIDEEARAREVAHVLDAVGENGNERIARRRALDSQM
jgi:hypothetical protein